MIAPAERISVSLLHQPTTDSAGCHSGILGENAARKFQIFDISVAVALNPHLQSKKKNAFQKQGRLQPMSCLGGIPIRDPID